MLAAGPPVATLPRAPAPSADRSTDELSPQTAHSARLSPIQPNPLVGRGKELTEICQRLTVEGMRLLTLTGPAGVGKTRLALAAVAEVANYFLDGVGVVDLTPVRDPQQVLGAIARTLGLTDAGTRPPGERIEQFLREHTSQLLILDNFEQVLPAAAQLADLLVACPGLRLLVTSRVPLQLRWEQTLRIAPLPVPNLSAALPPLDELLAIPSVQLFVGRARAHRADFTLTEARAPLVAQLVVQLNGLPLALKLAAARIDVVPLPTIVRRMGDRLRFLHWEAQDLPERQQSLEAALDWSYELLSPSEQRLFRHLGVFVGRVSLEAITAVVGVGAAGASGVARVEEETSGAAAPRQAECETLDALLSLAERSLVLPAQRNAIGGGEGNGAWSVGGEGDTEEEAEVAFGRLETVRMYAKERLAAAGELAAAHRAHAHYFLALAERAEPRLRGRDQRPWTFRLERELDNVRVALRWLLDHEDPAEREEGLRLAGALPEFWRVRGYHTEGWRWLEEALARAPQGDEADPAARTRALLAAGAILASRGQVARARVLLEEALALAERLRDPGATAEALAALGFRAVFTGEGAEAAHLLEEARRRWEALGNPWGLGTTFIYLGLAADARGDTSAAAMHYADALRLFGTAGDAQHAGFIHCFLGVAEWKRGDLPRAVEHIQATVRTAVALRNRWLLRLAVRSALGLVDARTDTERQARLLGAADALARATGESLSAETQNVVGLRERLAGEGEEGERASTYREGRTLRVGEVAVQVLTLLEEVANALPQPEAPLGQPPKPLSGQRAEANPLTEREVKVLRLVAQGLSSKAIGHQLFVSVSTVNQHLTSIFHKLGVNTRAQAVALAAQRGLI